MTDKLFITKINEIRERIRSTLGAVTLTDFTEELLEDRKWLFERLEIAANYDPSGKLRIERDELAEALRKIANPILDLQEEAKKNKMQLDGIMAHSLSENASYLKGLAREALSRIGKDNK